MPWKDQKTNTSGALWRLTDDLFTPKNGEREGAAKIALLITDGESNLDEGLVPEYSDKAKSKAEIFVVGVSKRADEKVGHIFLFIISMSKTHYKNHMLTPLKLKFATNITNLQAVSRNIS